MSTGDEIRTERIRKIEALKAAGYHAYPARTTRDTTIADFQDTFDLRESSGETMTLAGRVMTRRGQGGIVFSDLYDGTGRAQIVLQLSEMTPDLFALYGDTVDTGDFIEATGTAFKTQRGAQSLKVTGWKMLAKSLTAIPSEWYGIKDEETILRERHLDILMNQDVRDVFVRRAKFWHAIRTFLLERGFLEVETPVLESSPGGADARPFATHHNALDMAVYLRISAGELWQKRLLVAGYPKVFEIGRIFRNEGQSREHLQDYTQLETYEAYSDMQEGMRFTRDLFRYIADQVYGRQQFTIGTHEVDLSREWDVIDFCSAIEDRFGIDPLTCTESEAIAAVEQAKIPVGEELNLARAIDHLWKSVRKTVSGPAFLTRVPVYLEPLAKRAEDDDRVVERIQVLIAGSELAKGFSELNDPRDQRSRFEEQQRMREAGDDEAQRLDEEYVRAMEYGMPPAFGFGMSERVFAFFENRPIHTTQIFPLLRPR